MMRFFGKEGKILYIYYVIHNTKIKLNEKSNNQNWIYPDGDILEFDRNGSGFKN